VTERECWIDEEMCNAVDAGCFLSLDDPECRAYAERGWERELARRTKETFETIRQMTPEQLDREIDNLEELVVRAMEGWR